MVDDVKLIFRGNFSLERKVDVLALKIRERICMRTRSTLHNYCVETSLLFKYFLVPGFQLGDGMVVFNPRCFMMTIVFNLHSLLGGNVIYQN